MPRPASPTPPIKGHDLKKPLIFNHLPL
jgi:hypothetical protein